MTIVDWVTYSGLVAVFVIILCVFISGLSDIKYSEPSSDLPQGVQYFEHWPATGIRVHCYTLHGNAISCV